MLELNFSPFPVLTTQRLIMRQLKMEDENEIYALRSDEGVNRFLDRQKAKSIEDARKFITTISNVVANNEGLYWAITLKGNDRLIGTVSFWNISREEYRGEVGYELDPAFQGQGIMQEALTIVLKFGFDKLGFRKIVAIPSAENLPSIRLLDKLNFKQEKDDIANLTEGNKNMLLFSLDNT